MKFLSLINFKIDLTVVNWVRCTLLVKVFCIWWGVVYFFPHLLSYQLQQIKLHWVNKFAISQKNQTKDFENNAQTVNIRTQPWLFTIYKFTCTWNTKHDWIVTSKNHLLVIQTHLLFHKVVEIFTNRSISLVH